MVSSGYSRVINNSINSNLRNKMNYIRLKNNGMLLFDDNVPVSFLNDIVLNNIVDSGTIENKKWVCISEKGQINIESTKLLRKKLMV